MVRRAETADWQGALQSLHRDGSLGSVRRLETNARTASLVQLIGEQLVELDMTDWFVAWFRGDLCPQLRVLRCNAFHADTVLEHPTLEELELR